MAKIKELVKRKKRGILVAEDTQPSELKGKQVVLTIKHINEPKKVEPEPKKKAKPIPSVLQKLAAQRNWDKMQASTAIQHLKSLRAKLAPVMTFQYVYHNGLEVILDEIHKAIDKKWEQDKRAYLLQVEQEAFAAYPMSFRGSPAEINKRLDIMKAQEEF